MTFETGQSDLTGKGTDKQRLRRVWEIDCVDDTQGKCITGQRNSQCKDPNTKTILERSGIAMEQVQERWCRFGRIL